MRASDLIKTEPTPGEVQYLEDRLYEFNSNATGITDGEWPAIFVRDEGRPLMKTEFRSMWNRPAR